MRRLAAIGRVLRKPEPVIQILTLGEPETGLWCPDCLLPSRVRFPWLSQFGDGPLAPCPGEPTLDICNDCGRRFRPGEAPD